MARQRKCFALMLVLALSLLLCSPASADVITAMAIEINPEHLEKTASYARILGYNPDSNTLTVELIAPELFSCDDVEALQPGDSIYTDGREVLIETIEVTGGGACLINDQGEGSDSVYLLPYKNGNYITDRESDYVWNTVAVIECPVKDSLLCLNFIDDQTGNTLELPIVLTAQDLTSTIFAEQPAEEYFVTWASNKVYVVFDGEGNLAMIDRYVIPWYFIL
ncbi:MAG: hypothetical protein IKH30_02655 [Clostridia bacterium]|nr:hypothetical protein [Clostridia bacterium]